MTDKPPTATKQQPKPPAQAKPAQPEQQPQPAGVSVPQEATSTNFYWLLDVGENKFNLQTTLRGNLSALQVDAHINMICDALASVNNLGGKAKQVGAAAYNVGAATTTVTQSAQTPDNSLPIAGEQPDSGLPLAPEYVPPEPENIGSMAFDTQKLIVEESTKDGQTKRLYKIGGGKFMKFGVRVWDEVLESIGIKLDQLKVKEYPMPGYTAFYDVNAEGHPTKVVRLTKKA